jgi:uncharacterized damage-inducible protein DinB
MKTTDLLTLYDYSYWTSARILRAMLQLTPEQFSAPNTSSHGSLRGTLVHALFAQQIWRRRMQGEEMPDNLPKAADYPTPQTLNDAFLAEEAAMRAHLASLSDDDLQAIVHYKTTKGVPQQDTRWHLLMHVLNHGTQHYAEAAAMLTDFGCSPGDVDMILYFREKQM